MGKGEKAWRALDSIARELNGSSPEDFAREVKKRAVAAAKTVGVRALDRLVSKLAGRPVDTAPRALPDTFRAAYTPPAPIPSDPPQPRKIVTIEVEAKTARPVMAPPTPRPEPITARVEPEPVENVRVEPAKPAAPIIEAPLPVPEPVPMADPEIPPWIASRIEPAAPEHVTEISAAPPEMEDLEIPEAAEPDLAALPPSRKPMPSLPPRYGIDRVVLLAGESEFVFAYWETDPTRITQNAKAELRLCTEGGGLVGRAYVDPVQGRQHLKVPTRGKSYYAELVLLDGSAGGRTLSRSRDVVVRNPGQP